MEQLTLTYKDGQWADQHGRKVVNVGELYEVLPIGRGDKRHDEGTTFKWPGTYEVLNPIKGIAPEMRNLESIKLIPPTGSENSAQDRLCAVNGSPVEQEINRVINEFYGYQEAGDDTLNVLEWGVFTTTGYDIESQTNKVTHWMPLPPPPKTDKI